MFRRLMGLQQSLYSKTLPCRNSLASLEPFSTRGVCYHNLCKLEKCQIKWGASIIYRRISSASDISEALKQPSAHRDLLKLLGV